MKVVLIIPPSPWLMSDRDQPNTGMLYVASALKQAEHEVQVCDLSGLPEKYWYIPVGDIYGITGTSPQFPYIKKIIKLLKRREPEKKVIVGGVHATTAPDHVLKHTDADCCIIGYGEEALPEIISLDRLPKKYFRELSYPLDGIPFPDRDSIDYYDYLIPRTYKYLSSGKDASIITGRGCPYNCFFCASRAVHGKKVLLRTPENVFTELLFLKNKYGIEMCNFVDDTFILNKGRVREICNLIKPLNIKWYCLTRVDHVDYNLFITMKNAGCISVTFGFESGSNRMLSAMNKGTTVEKAYDAIDIVSRAGIKIRGQLMIGFPGEDDDSIEETAEFIIKSKKVNTFGLHIFQPYPGCEVWNNPSRFSIKINKDTSFSKFHSIGRPNARLTSDKWLNERFNYLKSIIGKRSIDRL